MRLFSLFAVTMIAVAGCTPDGPMASNPQTNDTNACGAAELQGLMGQPATVLDTTEFASDPRIIRRGDAVTADIRLDRLNIAISDDDIVEGVACG